MPTLWSQSFIPTARQAPAEAEVPSHQLLIRSGFIRKLGAGVYDYLPLGVRSLQKISAIIRQEMAAAGAVEVFLPTLVPVEMFEQTGRRAAYGDNLFVLKDRHGRMQALGPTHEEVVTEMVSAYVESYRQLPLTLYQIQTKFRDEFRPRFGVLRSREFQMKDAYSFHTSVEGPGGLNEIYEKQYAAYERIFTRCGLPYRIVEAESGPIGGSASHEFMVPSPTGEDTILESDKLDTQGQPNYAANVEKCEIGQRTVPPRSDEKPPGDLEKVHTPGCAAIEDVCKFMKVKPPFMLKTLVFECVFSQNASIPKPLNEDVGGLDMPTLRFIIAVVRGNHSVNESKLLQAIREFRPDVQAIKIADPADARAAGFAVGYVGPHAVMSRNDTAVFADNDAITNQFWAAGANEIDQHVKHFSWNREMRGDDGGLTNHLRCRDIRNAVAGDPSPRNDGGVLREQKGIEIGHVFKLGDKYTRAMNVTVLGPDNQRLHPIMGCYGIGVNRIMAAAVERTAPRPGNDENGIIWPAAIAPYQVLITPIKYDGDLRSTTDALALELEKAGIDVLIDDRDERPGVKFKDADLIGIPLRVTIGDRALAEGKVEIKARDNSNGPKGELAAIATAPTRITEMLRTL